MRFFAVLRVEIGPNKATLPGASCARRVPRSLTLAGRKVQAEKSKVSSAADRTAAIFRLGTAGSGERSGHESLLPAATRFRSWALIALPRLPLRFSIGPTEPQKTMAAGAAPKGKKRENDHQLDNISATRSPELAGIAQRAVHNLRRRRHAISQ
jgi:hypothetical protein